MHELYHIDPAGAGIRQLASDDGDQSSQCHGPAFYLDVATFVKAYLRTQPDPAIYEFLRYDFAGLTQRYGQVVATTFRNFPSYPQIYLDPLAEQPHGPETPEIVPPAPRLAAAALHAAGRRSSASSASAAPAACRPSAEAA